MSRGDAAFCFHCGAPLAAMGGHPNPEPPPRDDWQPEAVPPRPPIQQNPIFTMPPPAPRARRTGSGKTVALVLSLALGVPLVLIVGAAAVFVLLQGIGGGCLDPAERSQVEAAAQTQLQDLSGKTVSLRVQGTVENEVTDTLIILDPTSRQMRIRSAEVGDLRFNGNQYSVDNDTDSFYGRDHNPLGAMHHSYTAFIRSWKNDQDTSGLRFSEDRSLADHRVDCVDRDGAAVIEFTSSVGDGMERLVVSRQPPYRALLEERVDPRFKDDYRLDFSYGTPSVRVDAGLPKIPFTLSYETLESSTNESGNLHLSGRVADDSEFIPFGEAVFRLAVDPNAAPTDEVEVRDGEWRLDHGHFRFRDVDGNLMLSPGDTFVVDVDPGYQGIFFDKWAGAYALSSS